MQMHGRSKGSRHALRTYSVTVGSQIVAVVTVLCLGVLVAVGIPYGCGGKHCPACSSWLHQVLNSLSVNRIAILRVEVLGDDLTETEELTPHGGHACRPCTQRR